MNEDPQKAVIIARMEELGAAQVRLLMQSGHWPQSHNVTTLDWLSKKDQESERLKEASQALAAATASLANDTAVRAAIAAERQAVAAERANTRATTALVIAIISIAVSSVSIWVSHTDTSHQSAAP